MSSPPGAARRVEYEEDWLPEDFKPVTFKGLLWQKFKFAPLVGVGLVATVYSLVMATYTMKLGNSRRFQYWLRWRVGSQAFTILAAVYYGGVAFTREQQEVNMKKQMVMLGELPSNTPIPKVQSNWYGGIDDAKEKERLYREAVLGSSSDDQDAGVQEEIEPVFDETAQHYPLPVSERMRVSDFAARLRNAERAQAEEDEAKKDRRDGIQTVSDAGDFLQRRMERALEDRAAGKERKNVRVQNKKKLRKDREAEDAAADQATSISDDGISSDVD